MSVGFGGDIGLTGSNFGAAGQAPGVRAMTGETGAIPWGVNVSELRR